MNYSPVHIWQITFAELFNASFSHLSLLKLGLIVRLELCHTWMDKQNKVVGQKWLCGCFFSAENIHSGDFTHILLENGFVIVENAYRISIQNDTCRCQRTLEVLVRRKWKWTIRSFADDSFASAGGIYVSLIIKRLSNWPLIASSSSCGWTAFSKRQHKFDTLSKVTQWR